MSETLRERIIDIYDDAQPVGQWGVIHSETGELLDSGTLNQRTVKIADSHGKIRLESCWEPDRAPSALHP